MTYCTDAHVEAKLPTTLDAADLAIIEILRYRYYDYINMKLRPHLPAGVTPPLTPLNANDTRILTEIEALLCAGEFLKPYDDAPSGDERKGGQLLIKEAQDYLDDYIAALDAGTAGSSKRLACFGVYRGRSSYEQDDRELDADYYD